ncbi:MAG: CDP-alcohol phosphatidyltransferase family protein, partial [Methanomassiliicoccales archaeon]
AIFFSVTYSWLLLVAALLVALSGLFDALDGKVAKLTNKTSKRGDFLDHVADRYADIFMIGAVAVSAWCNIYLGILALIGVLMTSYMGTQAQALGIGRMYAGLLGRADRIVLMFLIPLIQFFVIPFSAGGFFTVAGVSFSLMTLMMVWFAVIGNMTALQRAAATWKALGKGL